jgi:hypothetical protein
MSPIGVAGFSANRAAVLLILPASNYVTPVR